ncbi:uncharacterized protein KY384_004345 [Bacidia gigantensis]|uniref:uncharacterized protein n=1 Tax=Bacidia gigantensis TaxID=2732470 RepID=UPI001D0376A1|nr:uncharacterized protein KY384_004345 [Bacidia gigantensis]KAG8530988.1 hypothetical protein KY384_004345 [Bacidia gigantensis]
MPQDTRQMQEEIDRREKIVRILGSWELLHWHSMQNNETRHRFKKQLIGIEDDNDLWEDEMADDEEEEEKQKKLKARRKGEAAEGSASGK